MSRSCVVPLVLCAASLTWLCGCGSGVVPAAPRAAVQRTLAPGEASLTESATMPAAMAVAPSSDRVQDSHVAPVAFEDESLTPGESSVLVTSQPKKETETVKVPAKVAVKETKPAEKIKPAVVTAPPAKSLPPVLGLLKSPVVGAAPQLTLEETTQNVPPPAKAESNSPNDDRAGAIVFATPSLHVANTVSARRVTANEPVDPMPRMTLVVTEPQKSARVTEAEISKTAPILGRATTPAAIPLVAAPLVATPPVAGPRTATPSVASAPARAPRQPAVSLAMPSALPLDAIERPAQRQVTATKSAVPLRPVPARVTPLAAAPPVVTRVTPAPPVAARATPPAVATQVVQRVAPPVKAPLAVAPPVKTLVTPPAVVPHVATRVTPLVTTPPIVTPPPTVAPQVAPQAPVATQEPITPAPVPKSVATSPQPAVTLAVPSRLPAGVVPAPRYVRPAAAAPRVVAIPAPQATPSAAQVVAKTSPSPEKKPAPTASPATPPAVALSGRPIVSARLPTPFATPTKSAFNSPQPAPIKISTVERSTVQATTQQQPPSESIASTPSQSPVALSAPAPSNPISSSATAQIPATYPRTLPAPPMASPAVPAPVAVVRLTAGPAVRPSFESARPPAPIAPAVPPALVAAAPLAPSSDFVAVRQQVATDMSVRPIGASSESLSSNSSSTQLNASQIAISQVSQTVVPRPVDEPRSRPVDEPRPRPLDEPSPRTVPAAEMPVREPASNGLVAQPVVIPLGMPQGYQTPGSARTIAAVSQRSQQQIRYAYSLAARGAVFSARAELIDALKLVALALDADGNTTAHSRALLAALTSLREADDFVTRDSQINVQVDVARVVSSHETPVLKGQDLSSASPLVALQTYYGFAQQQLVLAGDHQVAASMALYGLARIQTVMGTTQAMSGPKAIALHQSALAIDPRNYLAANELGVLLARFNQLDESEAVLQYSASLSPQPETWRNLATVQRRRGQEQLASHAEKQAEELVAARRRGTISDPVSADIVAFVEPGAFAATNEPPSGVSVSAKPAPATSSKSGSAGSAKSGATAMAPPPLPEGPAEKSGGAKPAAWYVPQPIRDLSARLNNTTSRQQ